MKGLMSLALYIPIYLGIVFKIWVVVILGFFAFFQTKLKQSGVTEKMFPEKYNKSK